MDFDQWLTAVSKGISLPREENSQSFSASSYMEKEFEEEGFSGAQEEGD